MSFHDLREALNSVGWRVFYWRNSDGTVTGFVGQGTPGIAPDGTTERVKGPYSSKEAAQYALELLCGTR